MWNETSAVITHHTIVHRELCAVVHVTMISRAYVQWLDVYSNVAHLDRVDVFAYSSLGRCILPFRPLGYQNSGSVKPTSSTEMLAIVVHLDPLIELKYLWLDVQ
ncbi:unnamed protein product [Somion occarium]|uniref:Uncharacterized protein n=1 Tax=Somion occarium TaxID=3059160 RepID=A0ABP1DS19_9APHY